MQISWTKLPFPARTDAEFTRGLTNWLSQVFYDILPEHGFEVREEQIYTAFRIARALTEGKTLFAEAGAGTGKTFAYLLPAVCYARFRGKPVVVASSSGVLQAQLTNPEGDIRTLSRLLDLSIDARQAMDPGAYTCEVKVNRLDPGRPIPGLADLHGWARATRTGARSEVPDAPDELWAHLAWDPSLPCDTCPQRGICHLMAARREYREAADLLITEHNLFARDLLTRADRLESGQMPLLPAYAAVVLDEGHQVPETWQKAQGYALSTGRLRETLELAEAYATRSGPARALNATRRESRAFMAAVLAAAEPGEGKRHLPRSGAVQEATLALSRAVTSLQDELVTDEAMHQGTDDEGTIQAIQARLDDVGAALRLFRSEQAVAWVEGQDLWAVPGAPVTLFGADRLPQSTPLVFCSATMEPAYAARVLRIPQYDSARVGVPFNLGSQVLVYRPPAEGDEIAQVEAVIRAMHGRTLVLLPSMAEVQRYKRELRVPWTVLFEGDADRSAMLDAFRADVSSVLVGASLWEGVDVPGEPLSCVVIPHLPFPTHDPLIRHRREQAEARGDDPFLAVDLPEMLLKLKQGAGRLIRTAEDLGVLALLDRSYLNQPWADSVEAVLPEDAETTDDLAQLTRFCPSAHRVPETR